MAKREKDGRKTVETIGETCKGQAGVTHWNAE